MGFNFQNNPENLDPSYKMDLDFWDYFERGKNPSYNQKNTVNREQLTQKYA